ncbi:hypothetical protein HN858_05055 [Candidatus Falkowbacteria bacterium]|jgi:hypothetical protein|nr:hypothetical protein [Candidatus Falkowbacteria bacterium]MBT5502596.1 hypothetical protein [Candidatus Falkowbacteria bacterium]MBT6574595.1 hypothetical protein [Candidatus Falkowbacteria bacterium]MBT7349006.1 hypothetical protein [Candidatus Falkowbacteria bacterium]MBT7500348.1 hypothetical protein [Candidatus Falkowbacteria bacterium]
MDALISFVFEISLWEILACVYLVGIVVSFIFLQYVSVQEGKPGLTGAGRFSFAELVISAILSLFSWLFLIVIFLLGSYREPVNRQGL